MNISGGYESKRGRTLLRHAVGFLDPQSNRRTFQGNLSLGGEKKKKKMRTFCVKSKTSRVL